METCPIEIVAKIAAFLDVYSLLLFSETCKKYNRFRHHNNVWKQLIERNFCEESRKILQYEHELKSREGYPPESEGDIQAEQMDFYKKYQELMRRWPHFYIICFHTSGGWYSNMDFMTTAVEDIDEFLEYLCWFGYSYCIEAKIYRFAVLDGGVDIDGANFAVWQLKLNSHNTLSWHWKSVDKSDLCGLCEAQYPLFGYFLISFGENNHPTIARDIRRLLAIEPVRDSFFKLMMTSPEKFSSYDGYKKSMLVKDILPACHRVCEQLPKNIRIYINSIVKATGG